MRTGGMNGADKNNVPRIKYHRKWVYGNAVNQPFQTMTALKRQTLEEALHVGTSSSDANDAEVGVQPLQMQTLNALRKLVRR